jgi:energy-coupling factor transporter ATP-binding protein EcfA2
MGRARTAPDAIAMPMRTRRRGNVPAAKHVVSAVPVVPEFRGVFNYKQSVKAEEFAITDVVSRMIEDFKNAHVHGHRFITVYGPRGAGKTMFCEQMAALMKLPFAEFILGNGQEIEVSAPNGEVAIVSLDERALELLPKLLSENSVIAFDEGECEHELMATWHRVMAAATNAGELTIRDHKGYVSDLVLGANTTIFSAYAPGEDDARLHSENLGPILALRYDADADVRHSKVSWMQRSQERNLQTTKAEDDFALAVRTLHRDDNGEEFIASRGLSEYVRKSMRAEANVGEVAYYAQRDDGERMAESIEARLREFASVLARDPEIRQEDVIRTIIEREFSGAELQVFADVHLTLTKAAAAGRLRSAVNAQQVAEFGAMLIFHSAQRREDAYAAALRRLNHLAPTRDISDRELLEISRLLGPLQNDCKALAVRIKAQTDVEFAKRALAHAHARERIRSHVAAA